MSKRLVVTYQSKRVDITDFIDKHPAGRAIIEPYIGGDITEAFDEVGHSAYARKRLERLMEGKPPAPAQQLHLDDADGASLSVSYVIRKLFTREDRFNVHKTLGLLCLASFVYRYCWVLPRTGELGFADGGALAWATLAAHWLLSCSSILFHVLERRIVSQALVIYEEYRLHAILFTTRAVAVSAVGLLWGNADDMTKRLLLLGVVLPVHLLADAVTAKYGTQGVTAVRVNNKQDGPIVRAGRILFASYQLLAVGCHLAPNALSCDFGYNSLVAIQSSAFLMTLHKKSLIHWYTYSFWYTLALFVSASVFISHIPLYQLYAIMMCIALRLGLNVNKYTIWFAYSVGSLLLQAFLDGALGDFDGISMF